VAVATYVGIFATILIALMTVTFHIGRLSARVDSLEQWRATLERQIDSVHGGIRHLEDLIKGEET
jgi:hypothetical protein